MGHIEHAAQLVFQLMRRPIVSHAATRQAVVHDGAAPHDLCAVAIVLGIL